MNPRRSRVPLEGARRFRVYRVSTTGDIRPREEQVLLTLQAASVEWVGSFDSRDTILRSTVYSVVVAVGNQRYGTSSCMITYKLNSLYGVHCFVAT